MRFHTPLPSRSFARGPLANLAARALLALAFLFAQHTASLHWLSHAVDATQAKAGKGTPAKDHCDECLALSALGAAAVSHGADLPVPAARYALQESALPTSSPAALRLAFRSRAPPILI